MKNNLIFSFDDINDTGFMPDFCDARVVFMLVLLVELLAILLSVTALESFGQFWNQLAFYSLLMQWVGLLNALLLCQLRYWINHIPNTKAIAFSFLMMMAVSTFVCLVISKTNLFIGIEFLGTFSDYFIVRVLVISAVVYAVLLRYFYIHQQWKIILQASSQAEIQALRARIRPHFLFNSMNSIASLISFQPDKAEKAIEDLADLFRASLTESNTNTLSEEINLIRSYLDIETLRLGERLKIRWDIDDKAQDIDIPALILQPLVENAIYHGIEPRTEGGEILISARVFEGMLNLAVSNPTSDDTSAKQHKGNEMAQDNIRQRLQLVYKGRASFNISDKDDEYVVSMMIPTEEGGRT